MSLLAVTTAALLVASPAVQTTGADAVRLAAHGGFLLGNARRCGLEERRVVRAGELVQALIAAAAQDDNETAEATTRFAEFFLATAHPDKGDAKLVPPCKTVIGEFQRLERHPWSGPQVGGGATPGFRPGDGE